MAQHAHDRIDRRVGRKRIQFVQRELQSATKAGTNTTSTCYGGYMHLSQNNDAQNSETQLHSGPKTTKDYSITAAAGLYALALLLGGLGIFSLFILPHSSLAIIGAALAIAMAVVGGLYSARSVVKSLRA